MLPDYNLPVMDHRRSQMLTDIQIDEMSQLRRCPEFRIRSCVCIVEEPARIGQLVLERSDLQSCAVQDSSIEDFLGICADKPGEGQANAQNLFPF